MPSHLASLPCTSFPCSLLRHAKPTAKYDEFLLRWSDWKHLHVRFTGAGLKQMQKCNLQPDCGRSVSYRVDLFKAPHSVVKNFNYVNIWVFTQSTLGCIKATIGAWKGQLWVLPKSRNERTSERRKRFWLCFDWISEKPPTVRKAI